MARKLQLLFRGSQVIDDSSESVVERINRITQDLVVQEYTTSARAVIGSGDDSEDEIRPLETLSSVIGAWFAESPPSKKELKRRLKRSAKRRLKMV